MQIQILVKSVGQEDLNQQDMVTGKGKVASQIFKEQYFRYENECNVETKQSTINKSGSEMFLFKNI